MIVDNVQVSLKETIGLSLLSKLYVKGNFYQTPTGKLRVGLNTSSQNECVVYLDSNKTFSGAIELSFPKNFRLRLYSPDKPSSWSLMNFNALEYIPEHLDGIFYSPVRIKTLCPGLSFKDSYNYSNNCHTKIIQVTNVGCDLMTTYYADFAQSFTTPSGDSYGCYVCVYKNSSCDLCGNKQCAVAGTCQANGVLFSKSSTCCPGGCVHGSCTSNGVGLLNGAQFQCSCNSIFYGGISCDQLSPLSWGLIAAGIFLFLVAVTGVYLHFRGIRQKRRMLDEIRDGILNTVGDGNKSEYIQGMQQALILNDVFVKYDEITIEEKVGEGGFGVVFKATFRGAQVAVKQMKSTFLELTDKEMDEFKREAYVMSR